MNDSVILKAMKENQNKREQLPTYNTTTVQLASLNEKVEKMYDRSTLVYVVAIAWVLEKIVIYLS